MRIDFRKLVEVLQINAPIHFTPREQLDKTDYAFCRFLGNAEKKARLAGDYNPEFKYDDSDVGLHFPDIEIEEFYELENSRNPVAVNSRINKISFKTSILISEIPLYFAVHSILHEYGHWIYFLDSKMTPYEYCLSETQERKPYEKMAEEIKRIPDWLPQKKVLAEKYDQIYSNFSSEAFANQYALERIEETISMIHNLF